VQDRFHIGLGDILKIGHGLLHQIVARVAQLQLSDPLNLSMISLRYQLRS
jgi:hypothetical protein